MRVRGRKLPPHRGKMLLLRCCRLADLVTWNTVSMSPFSESKGRLPGSLSVHSIFISRLD